MLRLLAIPVALSLMACGAGPEPVDCEIDGMEVRIETGATCSNAARTVAFARNMLAASGVVPSVEFEAVFAGLRVEVLDVGTLAAEGDADGTWGLYHPPTERTPDRVELTRSARSLLHELLHARQVRAGEVGPGSDPHAGWEALGYRALDAEFKASAPRLSR